MYNGIGKSCFFTGHRTLPTNKLDLIRKYLEENIRKHAQNGVVDFISGGARGFDLLAALAVLGVKREFTDIRLRLYLPYPGFERNWPERDISILHTVSEASAEIRYISELYSADCMKKRNMALVKDAYYGIAFRLTQHSGTAQTMGIARVYGREVINIADQIYVEK